MMRRLLSFCWMVWVMAVPCLAKPTLYLIGDSTVRNGTPGQMGWGDALISEFDPAKITVINRAIGGRSSRTFLTEGRWDAVLAHLQPGDFLLMQFGHNDGGEVNDGRCRASLGGVGEETADIVRVTDQQPETVRTFGWYLRKFVGEAKAKGAVPVVVSPIPRNRWEDGRVIRSDAGFGAWSKQVAEREQVRFIDFNHLLADRYERLGMDQTGHLFAGDDSTHTGPAGAAFNARVMAGAIRNLDAAGLGDCLLPADLWLPSIFSDHLVLQRGVALPVLGRATAGAEVKVAIAGKSAVTTADDQGDWKLELPAMEAGGPFDLQVSTAAVRRNRSDVWVGEVWFCSGQSNMDFTLAKTVKRSFSGVTDWQQEVAAADHPQVRMFSADWAMHEFPQREVPGRWAVCSPETAGDFSAVAYYFGRELQQDLKVAVGLVTCAYGASTIEAWPRWGALEAHPQFEGLLESFGQKCLAFRDDPKPFAEYGKALAMAGAGKRPKNPDPFQDQHNPSVLANGMVAPVAPYAIRGVIWYQGESNFNSRALYADLQQTLIGDWRQWWGNPELPFYYVQLASHKAPATEPSGGQLAEMRWEQAKALAIPHTGMVVTLDVGDEKDVHPRNKLEVGNRLARLALSRTYGHAGESSGPVYRDRVVADGKVRLRFDHAAGLVAKGGPLRQFSIAGADGRFVWADAVIEGDEVVVSNPSVPQPVSVRYAWASNPAGANLYNSANLPAAPFRSDP